MVGTPSRSAASKCHTVCGNLSRLATFLIVSPLLVNVANADAPVTVVVSNQTVPAGQPAQVQFTVAKPQAIASGELALEFDPSVFASIGNVTAWSASGDAYGFATVDGLHVDVHFWSGSGGLGRVAGNPIVAVNFVTLPGLSPGTAATVTADPSGSPWRDPSGNPYAVTVTGGTMTIGGTLAVRDVQPGSALLPAGTIMKIAGTGFAADTTVEIQAASLASTLLVSPREIDVTLAAPAQIDGKRVTLRNSNGEHVDYFPAWRGDPLSTSSADPYFHALPILPLQTYMQGIANPGTRIASGWFVLQNPNPGPADITLQVLDFGVQFTGEQTLTIPAGGAAYLSSAELGLPVETQVRVFATAPIRALELTSYARYPVPPSAATNAVTPLSADYLPAPLTVQANPDALAFTWQIGAAKPGPQTFGVSVRGVKAPSALTIAAVVDEGHWLSVTPSSASFCPAAPCTGPVITATVDPTGLAPGVHRGRVVLTPVTGDVSPAAPSVVGVVLTVTAAPPVINGVQGYNASFFSPGPPGGLPPMTFHIGTDIFPGAFSVSVLTDNGVNWLSAAPSTATAPATITLAADFSRLGPGRYSGEAVLTGSGNTFVIPVEATTYNGIGLGIDNYPLRFSAHLGDPAPPPPQASHVWAECFDAGCTQTGNLGVVPFTAAVRTNSGGNWLSASVSAGVVTAFVNPATLAPGIYTGSITLTSANATGPTQIPVELVVWTGAVPALTASPPAVAANTAICVSAGQASVRFDAKASTDDGGNWLAVSISDPVTSSCGLGVSIDSSHLAVGTHSGSIVVTIPGQSLTIPVTVTVPVTAVPFVGAIVNAASSVEGPVAAREIVSIHGTSLPSAVSIDGLPMQVLYASPTQINAIVPDFVATKNSGMTMLAGWGLPVAEAAPAIFPGAVLNQDNSVNGPAQPAERGSVIQAFGTGIGPIIGSVKVSIGGVDAFVQFAGQAPGAVPGLYQVNAIVPMQVSPGAAVPLVLSAGGIASPPGATIAVQ